MKKLILSVMFMMVGMTGIVTIANATILTSKINMDNQFWAYISTSDTVQGTQFSTGSDWETTIAGTSPVLNAGTDYFLHVRGLDVGGIAGFLGEFTLSGSDHLFSNDTTTLLTNITDWSANADIPIPSWGPLYDATMLDLGENDDSPFPWGFQPDVSGLAHWIWAEHSDNVNDVYFTTSITATQAVPEPITVALLGIGLAGLAGAEVRRRRKKRAVDKG